ncbi:MAG: hypothetical protein JKX73_05975, partial [Flavobacteriales bacterium]|nr:hypothetical protein [Flavobacteriales bacterium]
GTLYDAGSTNTFGTVIGISDANGDGVADTVTSTDGSGWVLLDNNGMAHVFFGNMRFIDDTPGDDTWNFFPGTNGIRYWNENFGNRAPATIGGALDINSNGTLDILPDIAQYFQALSTFPSAGIDANGCIYVSYSAIMENLDQGVQNYRHIYITKSCDNGCTWVAPVDVTPGTGFEENVYGSLAHDVDANIDLVWQRDFEPGIAVVGDNDAYVSNDIVHSVIPVTDINTAASVCLGWVDGDTLFCAGDSVELTATCGTAWAWSDGQSTQSIWYKGAFGDVIVNITTPCGSVLDTITVSTPITAPVISVSSTLSQMCPGDTALLTVTSNAGGTISWSTGGSTPTISVTTSGTYTVTVTNCGGVATDSYTITAPSAPTAVLSASPTSMCNGDTATLSVNAVSGGSYVWSTGDTTLSITVTTTGTYSVTVSNCAGTDVASTTISLPSAPVASITGNAPFCNGASITLTAGSQPSATYLWSTGATTQSITVTTAATFQVVVTNCGGSDSISVTTSFMAVPTVTVTVSGPTTFCADGGVTNVTLSAFGFGASPFSYIWSNGDSSQFLTLSSVFQSGSYTATAIDVCGISMISGATVITINEVVANVTSTNASCAGANGTATIVASTGTAPYTYSWNTSPVQTGQVATGLTAGTYTGTIVDANGCTDAVSVTITSGGPAPTATAFGTNPSTCGASDGSAIVTVSGGTPAYIYLWSTGSTTSSATNLSSGIYYVTVTDANGCQDSSFVTIAPSSAPSLTTTSTNSGCTTDDGTATVTVSGGVTPYTYLWNDPNSQSTATATGLGAGTYTIIVIDAASCLSTAVATVNSAAAPVLSASGTNPSSCGGTDGFATSTTTAGTVPFTYLWNTGSTSANIFSLSAGIYSLTVTDANGCSDSATVSLSSPGAPLLNITSTAVSCAGNDGTATASPFGGNPPYTYLWDDPSSQTTQTATGLGGGTYNVIVTDLFGCSAAGQVTLSATGSLTVSTVGVNPSTCGVSDGTASATVSGGVAPYTYLWDDPGAQTTQTATGLGDGVYNVVITDAGGCTGSSLVAINSPSAPSITAVGTDPSSCSNSDGSVTSTVTGGSAPFTYAWSSGGSTSVEINLGAGTYTVTVTDGIGCTDTATVSLTSPGSPTLVVTSTDASCAGNDGVSSVFATTGTSPFTYLWDDPANQTTSIASGLTPATYSVTVTDATGCLSSTSVTVGASTGGPTLTLITTNASCAGNDGSVAVSASGGTPPYAYLWSNGATASIVSNLAGGTYIVTVTDNGGCATIDTAIVADAPQITATSTSVNPTCGNSDGSSTLTASGGTAPYTYQWDLNAGNQTSQTATGLSAGSFSVTITDAQGCSDIVTIGLSNSGAATLTVIGSNILCNGANTGSITTAAAGGA